VLIACTGGYLWDLYPKAYFSMTPEERLIRLEQCWTLGGFEFLASICSDLATDEKANAEVYAFWRQKTLLRIKDARVQEKLAPAVPPHPMVARRHSLEQTYYEVFNNPNVELVDMNETSITGFTKKGIVTSDGVEREYDIVVLATGFDSVTGGIPQIDIRGVNEVSIQEKWKNGLYTHLGMAVEGFPNMFFVYGPQGPTALSNGPSCLVSESSAVCSTSS
jgi:cation diffusion facilitator CzcD-associated flavoprotein CzcO